MRNKRSLRVDVYDEEFEKRVYSGLLGKKELSGTIKKIKQKYD